MLRRQCHLNSVERLVALGGRQQRRALAMRQVLWGNGRAADFDNMAFGQPKFLIRISGKSQPNFLAWLDKAGGACRRKQCSDQRRLCAFALRLQCGMRHKAGDGLTGLDHGAQTKMQGADLPCLWGQHAETFARLVFSDFLIEACQVAVDL